MTILFASCKVHDITLVCLVVVLGMYQLRQNMRLDLISRSRVWAVPKQFDI